MQFKFSNKNSGWFVFIDRLTSMSNKDNAENISINTSEEVSIFVYEYSFD